MLMPSSPSSIARPGTLVLLAPVAAAVPETFNVVDVAPAQHANLLTRLQRMRGQVYLRDGAIAANQLTADGCHVQRADSTSWHVLSVQPDGAVAACARLRVHAPDAALDALGIWSSALAQSASWARRVRRAIEGDLSLAQRRDVSYVEFGGWAVDAEYRGTTQALTTAMSTYALGECFGGFLGVTTATLRHCSSRMLRKLGGHSFTDDGEQLPSYFDPQFECEMELLRFDSHLPSRRYGPRVAEVARALWNVPVVCATAGAQATGSGYQQAAAYRHVPCLATEGFAAA